MERYREIDKWRETDRQSGHPESNQGPSDCCSDLQSDALPTELSRFHTEIAVNGCGILMRATCVGVTRAVASADAPSNTDRPSQKKRKRDPPEASVKDQFAPPSPCIPMYWGGVSKAQRSTPRFCTTSRKRQTTIPGGSGSSTILNSKPPRSCRHGHMV